MLMNIGGIYFHPLEIPLLIYLFCAVALQFIYGETPIRVNKELRVIWLFISLILYIVAILLSTLNAIEISIVYKSALKWVDIALIGALLFFYISSAKRFIFIYWTLFAATFTLILWPYLGIIQGKVHLFAYRVFPGIEAAFTIALLLPFMRTNRKWIYFALFLGLISCLFSLSRMAWLALIACLLYYFYSQRSFRGFFKILICVSLILAIVLFFGSELLLYRSGELFSSTGGSNSERMALLKVALTAISDHPLIGVGSLNFSRYMVKEGLTEGIISPNLETLGPHNAFLQVASEEGLIGLLFFSLTIYLIVRLLVNAFKSSAINNCYLVGLCGFFIVMFFNLAFGFISAQFRFFLAIMIGLAAATMRIPLPRQTVTKSLD